MILFFDIETVGNKDLEHMFIEKYGEENVDKMGLYAEFSKIICISCGYIKTEGVEQEFILKSFLGDEKDIIEGFFSILKPSINLLCGYNINGFDIPFIFKRALVNGINIPKLINTFDIKNGGCIKPWELKTLDLAKVWQSTSDKMTLLDILCKILSIKSPKEEGIDGSMINKLVSEGKFYEISKYCERDVKACYDIYGKIVHLLDIQSISGN